ncbi:ACT domain-containing protein [Actinoplanes sp. L3-i22]|uniref:ACT domain-containing protein n=1 Tax=Actinoplanes sp. L3-i22 TaxID=2836373 RepID=UPI001C7959DA|nr:ACT domain-containing protein [Actinoplanes sp. L3-i22]BCY15568.1 ACT domain-containing protein [Actinoplanes sp. L3-i22]
MLDLDLLPGEYAVCRLPAGTPLPTSLTTGPDDKSVLSVTWGQDEISIICLADRVPAGAEADTAWRCLRVAGLTTAMTGVLASLVGPLADARVNIVTFSTYDTDYLLVPTVRLTEAVNTLTAAGHRIAG